MNKLPASIFVLAVSVATCAYPMDPNDLPILDPTLRKDVQIQVSMMGKISLTDADLQQSLASRSNILEKLSKAEGIQQLYNAARYENVAALKAWFYMYRLDLNLNSCDENQNSLMHMVCGSPDSGEKMLWLLRIGGDIYARNKQGQTPLERAHQLSDLEAAKVLQDIINIRKQNAADIVARKSAPLTYLPFPWWHGRHIVPQMRNDYLSGAGMSDAGGEARSGLGGQGSGGALGGSSTDYRKGSGGCAGKHDDGGTLAGDLRD